MQKKTDRLLFFKIVICIFILTLVKLTVTARIPILPLVYASADDNWAVSLAENLSCLQWLGPYTHMTLIKRIGFPMLLAVLYRLGIPYTVAVTLLYSTGTGIFAWGLFPLYKNSLKGWKWAVFILCLALVIFNPSTWSAAGLQRIYRNSITSFQLLWIMGGFFGLYFRRREAVKKQLLIMIFGVSLPTVWFLGTREDSVYLYVFLLTASVILALGYFRIFREKKETAAFLLKRLSLFLIPLGMILIVPLGIRTVNKAIYGVPTVTELSDSHFSDCIEALYAIDMPEEEGFLVTIPRAKFRKAAEVSPAFASILPELDYFYDTWYEPAPLEGERTNGLVFWYVREAAAKHGYHEDAVTADTFYKTCAEEIRSAFRDGRLPEKKTKALSALIPPFGPEVIPDTLKYTGTAITWVLSFEDCMSQYLEHDYPEDLVKRFEKFSHCRAVTKELPASLHRLILFTAQYKDVYRIVHSALLIFSLAGYGWLLARCIIKKRHKRKLSEEAWGTLLTGLALLLMFLLVCGIVGFNSSVNVYSVGTIYLLGAYPMIALFAAAGIMSLAVLTEKAIRKRHPGADRA